jgi:hypothetical protein
MFSLVLRFEVLMNSKCLDCIIIRLNKNQNQTLHNYNNLFKANIFT